MRTLSLVIGIIAIALTFFAASATASTMTGAGVGASLAANTRFYAPPPVARATDQIARLKQNGQTRAANRIRRFPQMALELVRNAVPSF